MCKAPNACSTTCPNGGWKLNGAPTTFCITISLMLVQPNWFPGCLLVLRIYVGGTPSYLPVPLCCAWCLQHGTVVQETLCHVTFECPLYNSLRSSPHIKAALARRDPSVFTIHRNVWSWRELKDLRQYFVDVLRLRTSWAGGKPGQVHRRMADLAAVLWNQRESGRGSA